MKKIIIIAIMAMLSMPAMAQSNRIYCEIVGTLKFMSTKIVVDVDFGQQRNLASNNKLVGEDGKPIKGIPRHPILEDDVIIYSNATILGRITIGKGATVGGNIWVTQDVAPGDRIVQRK